MASTDHPLQTMEQFYNQHLSLDLGEKYNATIMFDGSISPEIVESDLFRAKTQNYTGVRYGYNLPLSRNNRIKIPQTDMSWFKSIHVTPMLDNKIKKATLFVKLRVNPLRDEYFPVKTVENCGDTVEFFDKYVSCHFPLSVEFEFESAPAWSYSVAINYLYYKDSVRVDHQFYNLVAIAGANRPASPKCMSNGTDYSYGKYYVRKTRNGIIVEEGEWDLDDTFGLVTNPMIRSSLSLLPSLMGRILL